MRYEFYDSRWPSIEDLQHRIVSDRHLPSDEQAALGDCVSWVLREAADTERYSRIDPGSLPFAKPILDGLLSSVRDKHTPATLHAIDATLAIILDQWDLRRKLRFTALNNHWEPLWRRLPGYLGRHGKRLCIYLSSHSISPSAVSTTTFDDLRLALDMDPALKHPEEEWKKAKRTWEWGRANVEEWPSIAWTSPKSRSAGGRPWSDYRPKLRDEVEAALRPRPAFVTWDPTVEAAYAPDPDGLAHGVELVRICFGALERSGVNTAAFTTLGEFLSPEHFNTIAERSLDEAGGNVTRYVMTKLTRLHALATRCGHLRHDALGTIENIMKDYRRDYAAYCVNHPSTIEATARTCDAAETIGKLRELVISKFETPPMGRIKRSKAAEMKQIAMLAIRLDARLSTVTIRKLVWEKHFSEMEGQLNGCLRLHVPASETANGVEREAILCCEFSYILREFVRSYRTSLDISGTSAYLFPGPGAEPLSAITISRQQIAFLRNHSHGGLTPAVIRELQKRLLLEEAPNATGLILAGFGLRDIDYIEKQATPYRNDATARDYAKLVTDGALTKSPRPTARST